MRFLNARGVIATAFMIAACVQPSAAETIKIGVFGPFSGDAAAALRGLADHYEAQAKAAFGIA